MDVASRMAIAHWPGSAPGNRRRRLDVTVHPSTEQIALAIALGYRELVAARWAVTTAKVAGMYGNRTHPGRQQRPAHGLEDRGSGVRQCPAMSAEDEESRAWIR